MAPPSKESNAAVIREVEKVFQTIVESLCSEMPMSLALRHKKSSPVPSPLNNDSSASQFQVCFPGRTPEEAWRFAVIFRILGLVHEALATGKVVSKRNIYYKDPSLFKKQATVDRYVDILAYTFGVPRSGLNVSAAAKGLIAGHVSIVRPDGTRVEKGLDAKPYLVDDICEISAIILPEASWVLVVEKESTFRTLAAAKLHSSARAGSGIIVTAKGYPDISSRSFVHHISTLDTSDITSLPLIYALSDLDPDGIAIVSTFKHGSSNLSHETTHLNAQNIQWLGLKHQQLTNLVNQGNGKHEAESKTERALLRLSGRDRMKAIKMLANNTVFAENGIEKEWRHELLLMLMCNVKAEMEVLDTLQEGGTFKWVEDKLVEMKDSGDF